MRASISTGSVPNQLSRRPPRLEHELLILRAEVSFDHEAVDLDIFELLRRTAAGHAHRDKYRYRCYYSGLLNARQAALA